MENVTNPSTEGQEQGSKMMEIIKPETLVSIPMSSGYYKKIQEALGFLVNGKSADELNEAHRQINEQVITEEWVIHYETLLMLAKEFEELARKEGFIVKVTQEEAAEMLKNSL